MPDREKLIKLIHYCTSCEECRDEDIADHLIANGVTIGKPLTEYLHPIDTYEGLKGKYLVFKADTGEQVSNCFVLRPDKDPAAVEALRAYASATDNENLARDIYNWVGEGVTVQKWISVKDRLPVNDYGKHWKERQYYLVRLQGDRIRVARYGYKEYGWWVDGHACVLSKDHFTEVTHWMESPQPPKGE